MATLYMLEIRCADQLTKAFPRFTLADLYTLRADVDAKIAQAEAAGDKVEVDEPIELTPVEEVDMLDESAASVEEAPVKRAKRAKKATA